MSVQEVRSWVYTGGVSRGVSSVSVDREIAATTPASVGAPGGLLAATAEAAVHETSPVVGTKRSPWDRADGWPPAEGDAMRVTASLDGTTNETVRFEGTIEDVDGTARDLNINVAGADPTRRLHRQVSFDPQARGMPLPVESRPSDTIRASLVDPLVRHEWFVERALNEAGWFSTRQPRSGNALNVPFVGSLWDVHPGAVPRIITFPTDVMYAPVRNTIGVSIDGLVGFRWNKTINIRNQSLSFTVGRLEGGHTEQRMEMGATDLATITGGYVLVDARPNILQVIVRDLGSDSDTLVDVNMPWNRDDKSAEVTIERSTTYTRIYIDGVLEGEGPASSAGTFDRFTMRRSSPGYESRSPVIAGLVTGTRSEAEIVTQANAHFHLGNIYQDTYTGTPYWRGTSYDLIRELAASTACSAWIDRAGDFHWAHPDALSFQTPDLEITADADLLDLSWSRSVASRARRLYVDHTVPTVTSQRLPTVELWHGDGQTFSVEDSGDSFTHTQIASPSGGESWFVDRVVPTYSLGEGPGWGGFTLQRGDWIGATGYDTTDDGEEVPIAGSVGTITTQIDTITSQAYRVDTTVTLNSTRISDVDLRIPGDYFPETVNRKLMRRFNGHPLPVLRGYGKIEWETEETRSQIVDFNGVEDYTHSAGEWVQNGDVARLADWMGVQMTSTPVLLDRLPIVPRHDIDLGQVITVTEDQIYGVSIRALVIGVHETYSETGATMDLTLRVLSTNQIGT